MKSLLISVILWEYQIVSEPNDAAWKLVRTSRSTKQHLNMQFRTEKSINYAESPKSESFAKPCREQLTAMIPRSKTLKSSVCIFSNVYFQNNPWFRLFEHRFETWQEQDRVMVSCI